MPKCQDRETKELLLHEVKRLLFTLRPNMQWQPEVIEGYLMALDDLTPPEIQILVYRAVRTKWDFVPPTPGELREMAMSIREEYVQEHVASDRKNWKPSNPEWPEVKEFVAKLHEVAESHKVENSSRGVFHRPIVDTSSMDDQRRMLIDWYLRQDLNDGTPRSQGEIEAIKATKPHRKIWQASHHAKS